MKQGLGGEMGGGEFVGAMVQRLFSLKSLQNSKFEYGLSDCREVLLVKAGAQNQFYLTAC